MVCAAAFGLVLAPVGLVVTLGMSVDPTVTFPPTRVEPEGLVAFVDDPQWRDSVRLTLVVASVSSAIATSVASVLALMTRRARGIVRVGVLALMGTVAATPTVLHALGFVILGEELRIDRMVLMCWAHTTLGLPFAHLVLSLGVQTLRGSLIESAVLLGAGRVAVLVRVVMPHLAPFAVIAVLLCGVVSIAEPIIGSFLLSDGRATVAQRSFQGLRYGLGTPVLTAGAWTALLAAAATFVMLVLMRWIRVRTGLTVRSLTGTD